LNGKSFRGAVEVAIKDNHRLMVINFVPLEEYLYGVLHHEVSHRWPMEALKAQAIAARTFALYQMKQNKLQPYDLRSDIYSQVYGGSGNEKEATNRAVNETKGMVLYYKGEILPAYYHATCAGHTEDADGLWGVNIPPLKGRECTFCIYSPHYRWSKWIPLSKLNATLRANGYAIGSIVSIDILSKNVSGRVEKVELVDAAGKTLVLTGKEFRQAVGPNEVRSTKFDLSVKNGQVAFHGFGWGHGVGMCQWGAYGQALRGESAAEILAFYYPGSQIMTLDKV
jgi:stage II sporulation protein D